MVGGLNFNFNNDDFLARLFNRAPNRSEQDSPLNQGEMDKLVQRTLTETNAKKREVLFEKLKEEMHRKSICDLEKTKLRRTKKKLAFFDFSKFTRDSQQLIDMHYLLNDALEGDQKYLERYCKIHSIPLIDISNEDIIACYDAQAKKHGITIPDITDLPRDLRSIAIRLYEGYRKEIQEDDFKIKDTVVNLYNRYDNPIPVENRLLELVALKTAIKEDLRLNPKTKFTKKDLYLELLHCNTTCVQQMIKATQNLTSPPKPTRKADPAKLEKLTRLLFLTFITPRFD